MKKLAVSLAISLGAIAMQASIVTEDVNITPTSSGAGGTLAFNFAQFDPTLGTLNSVELTLTPTVGEIGTQIVNFGGPQTVTLASVSSPNGSLSGLGLDATWSSSQSLQINNYLAASGLNDVSLPFTSFTIDPSSVTLGSAGFVGNGTYTLDLTGSSTATSSGSPGSLFYGWYGNVGGDLEVDYNYTAPVPEPSTIFAGALLLLPLGVGAVRSFRKQRIA